MHFMTGKNYCNIFMGINPVHIHVLLFDIRAVCKR